MHLSRLIYASERVTDEKLDLMGLLQGCVENNRKQSVTGLLWYDGRHFIQCLEGGRQHISDLYSHITQDTRHKNIYLISFEDIAHRDFDRWAMGLAYDGNDGQNAVKHLKYSPTEALDPMNMAADSLLELLKECRDDI